MRRALACGALLLAGASALPAQAMRNFSASRPARAGDPALLRTTLDFGAGRVVLRAGAPDQLYRMQLRYDAERFAPIHDYEPAAGSLHLGLEQQGRGGIRVTSRARDNRKRVGPLGDFRLERPSLDRSAAKGGCPDCAFDRSRER